MKQCDGGGGGGNGSNTNKQTNRQWVTFFVTSTRSSKTDASSTYPTHSSSPCWHVTLPVRRLYWALPKGTAVRLVIAAISVLLIALARSSVTKSWQPPQRLSVQTKRSTKEASDLDAAAASAGSKRSAEAVFIFPGGELAIKKNSQRKGAVALPLADNCKKRTAPPRPVSVVSV